MLFTHILNCIQRIDWIQGFKSGIKTILDLGQIIFPIILLINILKCTFAIDLLASGFMPVTSWLGLPGEATIPLVLGFVDLYTGIGTILAVQLTIKQALIFSVMLSFAHSLPLESAICRRVGLSVLLVISVRLGLAIISAIAINLTWHGGSEPVQFSQILAAKAQPEQASAIVLTAAQIATMSILQLAAVVIPLMIVMQIVHDLKLLNWLASWIKPLICGIGISSEGSIAFASGLFFGLVYSAGVIIQQTREHKLKRREISLMIIFLSVCHAIFEDTTIFLATTPNILLLLGLRLLGAYTLTLLISWL